MTKSRFRPELSLAAGDGALYAEAARERAVGPARARNAAAELAKRGVDIVGALAGLFLFGPLMLIVAALASLDGASPIFAHRRIGRDGRPFLCLKFRTMAPDAPQRLAALLETDPRARAEWDRDQKLRNDPRVTPVGAFLRRTSLDELPQFINVLKGDMSLVGPRPIVSDEIPRYGDRFALYASCRPGITGIWQVSGRNNTSYEHRVALDAHYAAHRSLKLDASIMLRTFGVVLSGDGAR